MSFIILKFGGTSVSSRDRWENISNIVQKQVAEGLQPIVVCSALSQASNQLETILSLAPSDEHRSTFDNLIERYRQLSEELDVSFDVISDDVEHLSQLVEGISLVQEASPRLQAQVMAYGELMLTRLGAAFLERAGLPVAWQDARQWLKSKKDMYATEVSSYLMARCASDYDEELVAEAEVESKRVYVTQGFIASNSRCETVLLGRGGSDVSASYLAAKFGAVRCEIWTDVPGIYTANPQDIPSARHLRTLDYEEAQEIASMGGKVLHPNAIGPCRHADIPLHIKFTSNPEREGTVVSRNSDDSGVQIKSILVKNGVLLVSIETVRMWHQVGFLSDVFNVFKDHGLSIDLVSTSEASVTVSLDRAIAEKDPDAINRVLDDLNQFARAKVIAPCASVSLVGRNIRAILHQLGGVFEVFEAQNVYLLSQAANDLNLTFVVDEDQALRLSKQLHALLIDQNPRSHYLSKSWQEEFGQFIKRPTPWWEKKREMLLKLAESASPAYAYDPETLSISANKLLSCDSIDRVFFAMKANSNVSILKLFYQDGLNFECVSTEEIHLILSLFPDIDRQRLLFTPNFAKKEEYQQAFELKVNVTVDNLYVLEQWPDVFSQQSVLIRVDPGHGAGHHKFVVTGGNASKFGIPIGQLDYVRQLAIQHGITIHGLHIHSGSGILNPENWRQTAEVLIALLQQFPKVRVLNLGGGLGVVERPGQQALDVAALNDLLKPIKSAHPDCELWLEPGRYLVAEAGVILAKVTQLKTKGDTQFVGIETGMNSLIRPALYGSYHEIVNLTRFDAPKKIIANVVGPICESGDTLGNARLLPDTQEGDVMLIATAGAYGYVMSSHYNRREPAQEHFLE